MGAARLRATCRLTEIPKDVPKARLQGAPHGRRSLERRWRQEQCYSGRRRVQELFVRQYLHLQTVDGSWSLVAGKSNPETLGATGSRWWPVAGLVKWCVSPGGPRVVQATAPRHLSSSTSKSSTTIFTNILFLVQRRLVQPVRCFGTLSESWVQLK